MSATASDPSAAVLYVCAERSKLRPGLAAERAAEEGHAFADARGLRIVETITDPYGVVEPLHREGWTRVRELADTASVTTVIVRWPAVISPEGAHEYRHREIRWLMERGVQVRYSWEPLAARAATGGEVT